MKNDLRKATGLIIRIGNEYLIGYFPVTRQLEWRNSPWDAWMTRIPANAKSMADKTGGEIMLFNPIVGQLRAYRE